MWINKRKIYITAGIITLIILIGSSAAFFKYGFHKKAVVKQAAQTNKPGKARVPEKNNSEPVIKQEAVDYKYNDKSIPVLMYHSISYEKGNPIRLPKEKFQQQMQYLKDNGYTTLTLDDLYNFIQNNKPVPEKSVVITFDDGYADNYTNAYPVLKELGFKATIFDITSTVDKDPSYLTSKELVEMNNNGIAIESHTVTHKNLDEMPYASQLKECQNSKIYLESLLGNSIKYIAYPSGRYNENTIEALMKAGYDMAFTADGKWASKKDGIYKLKRVYISSNYDLSVFKERITNPDYPFLSD